MKSYILITILLVSLFACFKPNNKEGVSSFYNHYKNGIFVMDLDTEKSARCNDSGFINPNVECIKILDDQKVCYYFTHIIYSDEQFELEKVNTKLDSFKKAYLNNKKNNPVGNFGFEDYFIKKDSIFFYYDFVNDKDSKLVFFGCIDSSNNLSLRFKSELIKSKNLKIVSSPPAIYFRPPDELFHFVKF
jgi:hypothetical protein